MKGKGIIFVVMVFILSSCNQNNNNNQLPGDVVKNPNTASGKTANNNLPKFQFTEEVHDFEKIIQG